MVRELVTKEKELLEKIEFYISEMQLIQDLSEIEKYKDSESLKEKFNLMNEKAIKSLKELSLIKKEIDKIENIVLTYESDYAKDLRDKLNLNYNLRKISRNFK